MFLALREISRAKVRFALLAGAVGLLVFLILFQGSLRDGLISQFIGAVRNQSAPVLVYGEQARKNIEGSQISPEQQQAITAVDGVGRAGPLGEGTFTVTTEVSAAEDDPRDRLVDAVLFGYEIEGEAAGLGAPTTLSAGRLPEAPGEAVASRRNVDEGFDIGQVVRVEPDGLEITVVGLADDINYSVSPTMFVPWDTYEAARRVRNPDAEVVYPSLLAVEPAQGVTPEELTERIDAAVPGVEALTRDQAVDGSPGVASVRTSLDTVINLLNFAVFLVIALFLLILTVQKTGPLTMLRAIGARLSTLVGSLLLQAALIVLAGIVLGTALCALALAAAGGGIGASLEPSLVLSGGGVVAVAALVGSVFAVLRLRRIQPVEATQATGVLR